MIDKAEETFPDRLRIRDTRLYDDMGGAGQRIYTTAGQGYRKVDYVRADLHDAQAARISELVALLDKHYGTPCEEIRHAQEIAVLRERITTYERESSDHHEFVLAQINSDLRAEIAVLRADAETHRD